VHVPTNLTNPANTKSPWTQLFASTPADANFMFVQIGGFQASGTIGILDLAVGTSGNEEPIVNNLVCGVTAGGVANAVYFFPCQIRKNSRISGRSSINSLNDALSVTIWLGDGGFTDMENAGLDALSTALSTSSGTQVDPGATANVKGPWVQIVSGASRDYMGIYVGVDQANQSAFNYHFWSLDIAVGTSGSETIIIPDIQVGQINNASTNAFMGYQLGIFAIQIPLGTRITARAQCDNNVAASRVIGVSIYGIYQ
jgi:hypothetical protein